MNGSCVAPLPLDCAPSPQATVYDHGPSTPGSWKWTVTFTASPTCVVRSGPASTVGGKFCTVAVVVAGAPAAPLLLVTLSGTGEGPVAAEGGVGFAPVPVAPAPKSPASGHGMFP